MLNVTASNQILIEARFKAHFRFIKNIAPRIGVDRLSDETLEVLFESFTRMWQDLIISMKGLLYGNASCPKDVAQCTIDESCLFTSWMKRHSFMSSQLTILLRPNKQKNWNGRRSNSNQRSNHSNARQDSYVTDNTMDHDDGEQETVLPESRKSMRSASSSSSGPAPRRPRFQPTRPRR